MEKTLLNHDIKDAEFIVENGAELKLNLAKLEDFESFHIVVHVKGDAVFQCAFADFSSGDGEARIDIYLEEEGARAEYHCASLAKGGSKKSFVPSIYHLAPHTEGLCESYGITEGEARLSFTGVSDIAHGAKGSSTRQSAKIIVFDEKCRGIASPVLNIDENEVKASHAATVGKLNESHLFYLMSRGLSKEEARRLVTLGYLKPIVSYFEGDVKDEIDRAIEGGL